MKGVEENMQPESVDTLAPSDLKKASNMNGGGILWRKFPLNHNIVIDPVNDTLLKRVDRLDNLLAQMEDKVPGEQSSYASSSPQGSGRRWSGPPTPSSVEKRCKAAELVLEEVEEKGTLVERVSDLEKRVSKLQGMFLAKSTCATPREQLQQLEDDEQSTQRVESKKCEVVGIVTTITEHGVTYSKDENDIPGQNYYQGHMSLMSDGTVSEPEQKVSPRQRFKTKSKNFKKWLSKRLHLSDATQVEAH